MISKELSNRDFTRFSALVYEKCGINLHEGKKELVCARLGKRLRETCFRDFKAYYKFVTQEDGMDELVRMLDAISTNKTSFFREEKHFDFLKQEVVIKSLGEQLKGVKGMAGGAILADGRVGLILDVPGLFEISEKR